ncbi:MAG: ribosomal protein RSM22 (predicted rRNA methylase) [Candidatus Latescibacterota bacterium]|jgi:ribosomal protein RSM22 (predicted rRNA methylase)
MQLPPALRYAIEDELTAYDVRELTRAASELSDQYRTRQPTQGRFIRSELHRRAYIATRLPATYAAVSATLATLAHTQPDKIRSLLDLGAGSGSASWAAQAHFASLATCTLIERDQELITLGQKLAANADNALLKTAQWHTADLSTQQALPASDLVLASYALNELGEDTAIATLHRAWAATRVALVVVEPGTPVGFALIKKFRDALIEKGAHLLAPCPHAATCPLPADDWCHFAQRINRTSLHRSLKGGELGHEDEKFSYLIFTKEPLTPAPARILRHPQRRPGHVHLSLCTVDGLRQQTVTRSDKSHWKNARKTQWGDPWPISN